jgi:hypothetical protein
MNRNQDCQSSEDCQSYRLLRLIHSKALILPSLSCGAGAHFPAIRSLRLSKGERIEVRSQNGRGCERLRLNGYNRVAMNNC